MNITTACDVLQHDLKAYVDRELPPARRLVVRGHLLRCASCREEVSQMEKISNDLRAADTGALDPSLRAKLLANLANEPAPESDVPKDPVWRRHPKEAFAVAAMCLVLWFVVSPAFMQTREKARNPSRLAARSASAPPSAPAATEQSYRGAEGFPAEARREDTARGDGSLSLFSAKGTDAAATLDRKVRREGSLTVAVAKLEESSDAVEKMVKDAGGFVASNNLSTADEGEKHAALAARVPVDRFDSVLSGIARLGDVREKNVTGEDITEQVSDAQQAEQILAGDVRAVEAKIKAGAPRRQDDWRWRQEERQLRIQLAQTRARLSLLRRDAAFATIHVSLQQKAKAEAKSVGLLGEMNDAGRAAVQTFSTAAKVPVVMLIWVLAYAPLWVPLLIAYRWASRVQKQRRVNSDR